MSSPSSPRVAAAAVGALLAAVLAGIVAAAAPAAAYPAENVEFEGHGWGHGRGLGQYGSLGYAIDEGKPYSWMLDRFYGGTIKGAKADAPITVRLTEFDTKDLILKSNHAYTIDGNTFNAATAALVRKNATGYELFSGPGCGGPWTSVATLPATASPQATTEYTGDTVRSMLTTCGPTGAERSYRGSLKMVADGASTWVVNTLPMELYLRGVVPRESPASWADKGAGKGIEALKAQSVAARSYAWAENRSIHFKTCDTTACQVYGGAGRDGLLIEDPRSNSAIAATAGEVRQTPTGAIARTEFSSSTGGYTAGGTFPAVEDTGDDVVDNPNHNWKASVPVTKVQEAYPEIGTLQSIRVTKTNDLGQNGGRVLEVRVTGSSTSVTQTGAQLRSKLGLKSDWFRIVDVPVDISRLEGDNRFGTAEAVSTSSFPAGTARAAVIASAFNYPDALVGVPLAVAKKAPILLSDVDAISQSTMAELQRATGGGKTVYLLGGTVALGTAVEEQLKAAGYTVVRYAGANRYATAVQVADALGGPSSTLLATGTNFPDALAAGAAAAKAGAAVLLTHGNQLPPETAAYIAAHPGNRHAIGGSAAAADPTASPIVGADRYETAVKVAAHFFTDPAAAGLASGVNFPDALSGGVHAVSKGGPLLLTATSSLPQTTEDYVRANAAAELRRVYAYGGPAAIAHEVLVDVREP